MMAQNPDIEDQIEQAYKMAPPVDQYAAAQMAPVDPHATLTAPIGPPAPEPVMPGSTKMSAAPAESPKMSLLKPQEEHTNNRLMADYKKDADPYGSPDNHPGFFGKLLHGLNVMTGGETRRGWEEQGLQKNLQDLSKEESAEGLQGAETTGKNLENANEPQEAADKHTVSQATSGNLDSETEARNHPQAEYDVHDTAEGPMVVNKKTGVGQHLSVNGLPVGPKVQTKVVPLQIGGEDHQVLVNDNDGTVIKDLGKGGIKPPTVHVDSGAHEFAEQERGRGLLDKAEGAYRTAQQGANTMRDMVASADAGNKMSAQVLPLEGALAITTAQGVHRINRTEVDQYAGAGSLYDKIAGELGKVTSGQPIPPNIRNDIRKLTDIQEKGAYQTYKGAHDSAVKRYGLQGEDALPEPGGSAGPQRPSNVPEGYKFNQNGPKGAGWYAPTAK